MKNFSSYVKQKSASYLFFLVKLWNQLSGYNFIIKKYLTSLTKCERVSFISKTYNVITKSYLTNLSKCESDFEVWQIRMILKWQMRIIRIWQAGVRRRPPPLPPCIKHNLVYFAHFNFGTIKRGGIPSEAWQVLPR